jgi:hypothetical protein
VHSDPTKPDNRKIDMVKLVIKSSNEKPSDFCSFDVITVDGDQQADVIYTIDHSPERDNMYVATNFTGFDYLADGCGD